MTEYSKIKFLQGIASPLTPGSQNESVLFSAVSDGKRKLRIFREGDLVVLESVETGYQRHSSWNNVRWGDPIPKPAPEKPASAGPQPAAKR